MTKAKERTPRGADRRLIAEVFEAIKAIEDPQKRDTTAAELVRQLEALQVSDTNPLLEEHLSIWEPGEIEVPLAEDFHRLAGTRRS